MSSSSSAIFSGNSRYSADFQSIIDRTVAIASLPISQLNDAKTALTDQSEAVDGLQTKFEAVQTAVQAVSDALGSSAYAAAVSDATIVTATLGADAMEGSYSISVADTGSYSTGMSADLAITDPDQASLTTATQFELTVGAASYTITPAANTLTALAQAINAETDAHVRATVVNVGGAAAPDYRLSLERTELGSDAIQLNDGATPLLTGTTGTQARYTVNGVGKEAQSTSRMVTIAPGLTLELLATGDASVTVTRQSSVLSDALSSFANAYNAAMTELDLHRGDAGGVLTGQEIVLTAAQSLHEVGSWTGSGTVAALGDVGLSFDENGVLSFDPLSFTAKDWSEPAAVQQFLTSFASAADDILDGVADPILGRIHTASDAIARQISDTDDRITDEQDRIDRLRSSLSERMAAADALIATMEQQYNYLNEMFAAMQSSAEFYK